MIFKLGRPLEKNDPPGIAGLSHGQEVSAGQPVLSRHEGVDSSVGTEGQAGPGLVTVSDIVQER